MNKHQTDAVSLAFGSVFLLIVASWLLAKTIHIGVAMGGWILAGGLVLLGLAGVAVTVRPPRS